MKSIHVATVGVLLACTAAAQRMPLPSVALEPGTPQRLFVFTNRNNAFFCGVANGTNTSGFHGVTRDKRKLFENIRLLLGDSLLDPATATVTVTPAQLVRRYPFGNTREEWTFIDSLTLLVLRVTTAYRGPAAVIPMWSSAFAASTGSASAGRLTVATDIAGSATVLPARGQWEAPDGAVIMRLRNPGPFTIPAWYATRIDADHLSIAIEFAPHATGLHERSTAELSTFVDATRERALAAIETLDFRCGDPVVEDALRWVTASMDALVMEHADGIYAGLPWFDDFWGRDTFIAFRGALLTTGRFEEAREVLRAFMARQNTDENDSSYGRIPNRVQPGEVIYNTADGTPLFVRAVDAYIERSGDTAFRREVAPVLRRAIEGTLRYHCDTEGLLVHGDAETWMDAVGPDGPWSPRGNRALEIQMQWLDQLTFSAQFYSTLKDHEMRDRCLSMRESVKSALQKCFLCDSGVLADRIRSGGSADTTSRPNVFLAVSYGHDDLYLFRKCSDNAFRRALQTCVSRDGVSSLSFTDPNFHPWHEEARRYPKDAAYHNGTIWTWLTGPVVRILCSYHEPDSAWVLTAALLRLLREQGAIGTLPECTDGCPRPGASAPRWSGTFSQAWSNAELLRSIVEDYMGIIMGPKTRLTGSSLEIQPALPAGLPSIACNVRIGNRRVRVEEVRLQGNRMRVRIDNRGNAEPLLVFNVSRNWNQMVELPPDGVMDTVYQLLDPNVVSHSLRPFTFATCRDSYPVLAPRASMELEVSTVLARNPSAASIASMQDAVEDDRGPSGTYTYPTGPHFKPGMFDILHFQALADEQNLYFTLRFRALAQPGWHPEYGFQLTMAAIAIDQTQNAESGAKEPGANSRYRFPSGFTADRTILIGGGVQVLDAKGDILAEYVPVTEGDAFGNAETGTISFAIPRGVLGIPSKDWRWLVVAGEQDDHGGGGIGEFRSVLPAATEWNGGGNANGGSNVFDVLGP